MYAAYKHNSIRYTIYEGITKDYPKCFRKEIIDHTYVDEFGFSIYNMDTLVEGFDIFIMNSKGDIRRTNIDSFDDNFIQYNQHIAVPRHGVIFEYAIFDSFNDLLPGWVEEAFDEGAVAKNEGVVMYYDHFGETPMNQPFILLKNKEGKVKTMDYNEFSRKFYTFPSVAYEPTPII